MEEESWVRLLDSDRTAEEFSKELSSGLLGFVKDEGPALDPIKRTKVLMSLLYLNDEQLAALEGPINELCEASEIDAEDWVRVVSGIVLRWLRKAPKDKDDAFLKSTNDIARIITAAEKTGGDPTGKFSLPLDVIPTHWPFLATQALPEHFDVSGTASNQHFTVRARGEAIKRLKMVNLSAPLVSAPSIISVDKLPPKAKELLENAPLLTPENREAILRFFAARQLAGYQSERNTQ